MIEKLDADGGTPIGQAMITAKRWTMRARRGGIQGGRHRRREYGMASRPIASCAAINRP